MARYYRLYFLRVETHKCDGQLVMLQASEAVFVESACGNSNAQRCLRPRHRRALWTETSSRRVPKQCPRTSIQNPSVAWTSANRLVLVDHQLNRPAAQAPRAQSVSIGNLFQRTFLGLAAEVWSPGYAIELVFPGYALEDYAVQVASI